MLDLKGPALPSPPTRPAPRQALGPCFWLLHCGSMHRPKKARSDHFADAETGATRQLSRVFHPRASSQTLSSSCPFSLCQRCKSSSASDGTPRASFSAMPRMLIWIPTARQYGPHHHRDHSRTCDLSKIVPDSPVF